MKDVGVTTSDRSVLEGERSVHPRVSSLADPQKMTFGP